MCTCLFNGIGLVLSTRSDKYVDCLYVQGGDTRLLSVHQVSVGGWRYVCLYFFIFIWGLVWRLIVHMVVWCLSGVCFSVDGAAALCTCGSVVSVWGSCSVCLYL
jgi:hypothetical protein